MIQCVYLAGSSTSRDRYLRAGSEALKDERDGAACREDDCVGCTAVLGLFVFCLLTASYKAPVEIVNCIPLEVKINAVVLIVLAIWNFTTTILFGPLTLHCLPKHGRSWHRGSTSPRR